MSKLDYQARIAAPAYIERERVSVLQLRVYAEGALVAPTSGAVTIYNAEDVKVVDAGTVTTPSSVATYEVATASVQGQNYGPGWRVEWTLNMPDGYEHLFTQTGALVRRRLYPVITDADLLRRQSTLDDHLESGTTSMQDYIEEAWVDLTERLAQMGRKPYLVATPESLRSVHLFTTLEVICEDFAGSGDPNNEWAMLAERYGRRKDQAWSRLNFEYDENNDGDTDGVTRKSGASSVWLGSVRNVDSYGSTR